MTVQLIVCPVCHTQQPNAWDCAVCARPLHERPTSQGLRTESLPELEITSLGDGGNVAVAALDGLEITSLTGDDVSGTHTAGGPELLPPERLEGLEPTLLEIGGGGNGTVDDLWVDLEPTQLADAEAPSERGPIICRVCSTPWRVGTSRFCGRCGMLVT